MPGSFSSADQHAFRHVNDDGNEATSTFGHALNTNWTQPADTNFRLRYAVALTSGVSWISTGGAKFQYNKNGSGWNDITSASSVVRLFTSTNVTDETATTQRISSGSFTASNVLTSSTSTTNQIGAAGNTFEIECCIQIRSVNVTVGDTIQIRVVTDTGTVPTTSTNTVTITAAANPGAIAGTAIGTSTISGTLSCNIKGTAIGVSTTHATFSNLNIIQIGVCYVL